MSTNKITTIVIEKKFKTDNLLVIKIKPNSPFAYRPGQYCAVGVNGNERPYSIVSAPHEKYIELFVELVRDGTLTRIYCRLTLGILLTSGQEQREYLPLKTIMITIS